MQVEPAKFRNPLSNFNLHQKFKFKLYDSEALQVFFTTFRIRCYFLLVLSPFALAAPAYLTQVSFGTGSIGISIGLFLLSLLLVLPWTLVPVLFLFTTFSANTWHRKVSWAYVALLLLSYIIWMMIF
ncbi:hypothetical protein ACLM5H_22085 [Fredinandcohnia humi]